jgi:hypothetical protein
VEYGAESYDDRRKGQHAGAYLARCGDEHDIGVVTHNFLNIFSVLLMRDHEQRLQPLVVRAATT